MKTQDGHELEPMACWEREDRCVDCPADHPENGCNKYRGEERWMKKA